MSRVILCIIFFSQFSVLGLALSEKEIDTNYLSNLSGNFFIENKGQLDDSIYFYTSDNVNTMYFTAKGLLLLLNDNNKNKAEGWLVELSFIDSNPDIKPEGASKLRTSINYYHGNPDEWNRNLSTFYRIKYKDLWPGIDLIFYSDHGPLKYDFIVHPGADPNSIRFSYNGITNAFVDKEDNLLLCTPLGQLMDSKPKAYQITNKNSTDIDISYSIVDQSSYLVGYDIGNYDSSKILVIDPTLLICGYIGGIKHERYGKVAVDEYGNIYVTGVTYSNELSFPVKTGPCTNYKGEGDVYIAKINAAGNDFEYCGYIGGYNYEKSLSIDVDSEGCAYIVGHTSSSENDGFPLVNGPDLTFNGGKYDGFVAKVSSDGSELEFCGYIGGEDDDLDGYYGDIIIDDNKKIYIVGSTNSSETSFPVINGPDTTYNGYRDAFIAKLNTITLKYDYCGYIGGTSLDEGNAISVDKAGNAYIGGVTYSNEKSFPVKGGPDLTHNGKSDAFIAKINSTGTSLIFCGYLGGAEREGCDDIALDYNSNIYCAGITYSSESTFPVTVGPDLIFNGDLTDVYIAKISSSILHLVYCGYIGGDEWEGAASVAVDDNQNVYVFGETLSDESSFPTKTGPDITFNGASDTFISKINKSGSDFVFSGYLGGDNTDQPGGLAIDKSNNIYICGYTKSTNYSFPLQIGPSLTYSGRIYYEGFIAKILQSGLHCDTYEISRSGGKIDFQLDGGIDFANREYILLGALNSINPGSMVSPNNLYLPFMWDFFSNAVYMFANNSVFIDFQGTLDSNGKAYSKLMMPAIRPEFVGIYLYFAFLTADPIDYISNPVPIKITW